MSTVVDFTFGITHRNHRTRRVASNPIDVDASRTGVCDRSERCRNRRVHIATGSFDHHVVIELRQIDTVVGKADGPVITHADDVGRTTDAATSIATLPDTVPETHDLVLLKERTVIGIGQVNTVARGARWILDYCT